MLRYTTIAISLTAPVIACDTSVQCPHDAREVCVDTCSSNCISQDGRCQDSSQCGSGLECTQFDPTDRCVAAADLESRCRPGGFDRLALQKGFRTGGMQISIDQTDSTPEVTWQAPRGSDVVACALFSCNPEFMRVGCSPTGEHELMQIVNFKQCVLLFGASPSSQLSFALIRENEYTEAEKCTGTHPPPRLITKLAAGCWSYDGTSLTAASELVHVAGTLLPDLPIIPHDSLCTMDGDNCYDGSVDRFGVCLAGICSSTCMTGADCARSAGSVSPGASCDWSCRAIPGHAIGACVHTTP